MNGQDEIRTKALRRLAVIRLQYKTPKTKAAPPNYRPVQSTTQKCGTCRAYNGGRCQQYGTSVKSTYKCDTYRPDTAALREVIRTKHLPGKHDQRDHYRRSGNGQQSSASEEEQSSGAERPEKGRKRQPTKGERRSTVGRHKAAIPDPGKNLLSTQINMPPDIQAMARLFAQRIPTADLAEDGIETDSHVTAFFGLLPKSNTAEQVEQIANTTGPITITLGTVSLFTDNPGFDVVKVEADGSRLREINQRLGRLPNANNRNGYNPHMTIAYVKKGRGAAYVGDPYFNGRTITVTDLILSSRGEDGQWVQTPYPLLGNPVPKIPQQDSDIVNLTTKARAILAANTATAAPISEGFGVLKDASGEWRWVSVSSNAYRDRDREIVSEKALAEDVAYADRTKEYGPLRFWHMPGVDIGTCDYNAMHGRMLIESGTFKSKAIGERISKVAQNYQISIGFRHPPDQPDHNGVYKNIRRFERSLVPAGLAANPFTKIYVRSKDMNNAKIEALKTLLGDEAAAEVLSGAQSAQKQAEDMGVAFKDVNLNELAQSDPQAFLELALKNFDESTAEKGNTEKMGSEKVDEKEDEEDGDEEKPMPKTMKDFMDAIDQRFAAFEAKFLNAQPSATKDANTALAEASALQSQQIQQIRTDMEAKVKSLTDQLQTAVKELKELQVTPAAFEAGYRPSEAAETTKETEAEVETEKAAQSGGYDGFLSFLSGPLNGQQPPQ